MSSIIDDIKSTFRQGSSLVRITYILLAVFLAVNILRLISWMAQSNTFDYFSQYLMLPAHLPSLAMQPWSLFTYMFYHTDLLHILFNLLWFYFMGKIFIEYLGSKRLVVVYILGGLFGAMLYLLAYNVLPVFSPSAYNPCFMLGASASVMAIVWAITLYVPDYTVWLLLFGPVKLKYIALVTIVLDVISIPVGNAGGHIAHLGGALYGVIWALMMRRGIDHTQWFIRLSSGIGTLFTPRKKMAVSYRNPSNERVPSQTPTYRVNPKQIDEILDKISRSGYDSLSDEEKAALISASKKQ